MGREEIRVLYYVGRRREGKGGGAREGLRGNRRNMEGK